VPAISARGWRVWPHHQHGGEHARARLGRLAGRFSGGHGSCPASTSGRLRAAYHARERTIRLTVRVARNRSEAGQPTAGKGRRPEQHAPGRWPRTALAALAPPARSGPDVAVPGRPGPAAPPTIAAVADQERLSRALASTRRRCPLAHRAGNPPGPGLAPCAAARWWRPVETRTQVSRRSIPPTAARHPAEWIEPSSNPVSITTRGRSASWAGRGCGGAGWRGSQELSPRGPIRWRCGEQRARAGDCRIGMSTTCSEAIDQRVKRQLPPPPPGFFPFGRPDRPPPPSIRASGRSKQNEWPLLGRKSSRPKAQRPAGAAPLTEAFRAGGQ